jgi:hypothetical protein
LKSSYYKDEVLFTDQEEFLSLPEIQQRLGHVGRRIDIFKIDCESCEWYSYKDWVSSDAVDIRQIQVEVHGNSNRPVEVTLRDFFQAFVDNGFVMFSKEMNTHPRLREPARGTLYEYSFIKLAPSFLDGTNKQI